MHRAQQHIQGVLERLVAEGREQGVQLAAYYRGKLVVNAWAGIADVNTGERVGPDTLFPVFSVTKGMVATIVHLLVERGLLAYDTPVAKVWPEFGGRGKERITVRQMLNHSAGVPQIPAGLEAAEVCDWELVCRAIAQLTPLWPAGTRIEYHGMTYGWILGEVARRVDGRGFSRLLQEEICRPLGITTMFAGLPDELAPRVAFLEAPDFKPTPDDGKPPTVPRSLQALHVWMNRADARCACIPASNGIMNAFALARHYAALLPGGVDGVELLPPERVRLATVRQRPEHPDGGDYPVNFALGYSLGEPDPRYPDSAATYGHGGHGGSNGFADRSMQLAVGFTRNLFRDENPAPWVFEELRRALREG